MFINYLSEMEYGNFIDDCNEALRKVIPAVAATQKDGQIQVTLVFEYVQKGFDQVVVRPKLKYVVPERDRAGAIYYISRDKSELTKRDPRQPELPFRPVTVNEPPELPTQEASNG